MSAAATRVTVLGLAAGDDVFDVILENGDFVLARVGPRLAAGHGLAGPLLLVLTWVAALYAKVGARRLPGATGHGLSGGDEAIGRERLRMAGLTLDEISLRDRRNVRLDMQGLSAREIETEEAPLVEISGGGLRAPLLLEATGDPPRRLLAAMRERGAAG